MCLSSLYKCSYIPTPPYGVERRFDEMWRPPAENREISKPNDSRQIVVFDCLLSEWRESTDEVIRSKS